MSGHSLGRTIPKVFSNAGSSFNEYNMLCYIGYVISCYPNVAMLMNVDQSPVFTSSLLALPTCSGIELRLLQELVCDTMKPQAWSYELSDARAKCNELLMNIQDTHTNHFARNHTHTGSSIRRQVTH